MSSGCSCTDGSASAGVGGEGCLGHQHPRRGSRFGRGVLRQQPEVRDLERRDGAQPDGAGVGGGTRDGHVDGAGGDIPFGRRARLRSELPVDPAQLHALALDDLAGPPRQHGEVGERRTEVDGGVVHGREPLAVGIPRALRPHRHALARPLGTVPPPALRVAEVVAHRLAERGHALDDGAALGPSARMVRCATARSGAMRASCSPRTVMTTSLMGRAYASVSRNGGAAASVVFWCARMLRHPSVATQQRDSGPSHEGSWG